MSMKKLLSLAFAAGVALTGAMGLSARAEYPEKPIQFIVPWPPGDMEDVLTRMIAEDMQKAHGQPAAVVNKPGGGGGPFPGAAEVAKATADGYTIGSFVIGVPVVGPKVGIPELNPNPFEPIGIFLTYPFVIVAGENAPYSTMKELADHAKSNKVVLGHFGAPLIPTKVTKALAKNMGFSYASDAAFDMLDCNTLASGDVDVMNTTIQLVLPCLEKIKVLAAVTDQRIPVAPDAPTVSELDKTLNITLWNGLFVHKDVPQDARDKIAAVAQKTIASQRAQDFAKKTGAQIYWKDAAASTAQVEADIKAFGDLNAALQ
ncbi:MAG: tripartite tricarboxylate transporter substrate binding protein [Pseudomonadota bacterium]